MTIPQFAILVELAQNDGMDQGTLGERVLTDPSTTTDLCRRLLARGQIERGRDPADQRRNVVRITAAGRARLAPMLPLVDEVLVGRLTQPERRELVRSLRKVVGLE